MIASVSGVVSNRSGDRFVEQNDGGGEESLE